MVLGIIGVEEWQLWYFISINLCSKVGIAFIYPQCERAKSWANTL
jgi:hypothetical protein